MDKTPEKGNGVQCRIVSPGLQNGSILVLGAGYLQEIEAKDLNTMMPVRPLPVAAKPSTLPPQCKLAPLTDFEHIWRMTIECAQG